MSNTKIIPIDGSLNPNIIKLSRLIHPHESDIQERVSWFTYNNPFLESNIRIPGFLVLNNQEEAIGQFLFNRHPWHLGGCCYSGYYGYDFFVKKDQRGSGGFLYRKGVNKFNPFFGIGITDITKRISDAIGLKTIGSMQKFLWLNKPISSSIHFLKYRMGKKRVLSVSENSSFPERLNIKNKTFKLLKSFPADIYHEYYDPEVIEFSRSGDFIKWRFFDSEIPYQFYYCDEGSKPAYFVLRSVSRKGMRLLLIVDYKTPLDNHSVFRSMLKLVKKIVKNMNFDGAITLSSYRFFDTGLKKEHFFSVDKTAAVSTIIDGKSECQVSEGTPISLTMADADLDLNFGDKN